jgi:hypothetical protein
MTAKPIIQTLHLRSVWWRRAIGSNGTHMLVSEHRDRAANPMGHNLMIRIDKRDEFALGSMDATVSERADLEAWK